MAYEKHLSVVFSGDEITAWVKFITGQWAGWEVCFRGQELPRAHYYGMPRADVPEVIEDARKLRELFD